MKFIAISLLPTAFAEPGLDTLQISVDPAKVVVTPARFDRFQGAQKYRRVVGKKVSPVSQVYAHPGITAGSQENIVIESESNPSASLSQVKEQEYERRNSNTRFVRPV